VSIGTNLEIFRSDNAKTNAVEIDPTISLDLFFRRRFGLSFEVPALVWIATGREAVPRAVGALGDPEVTTSYTFRLSDWRLSAALSYTHPLGIWNYYEARERQIASGSGYPTLGASFSALRYLDPIVAGASLCGETCFARPERSGTSTRPLILTAKLFATEALNDVVALSASLSPKLTWPRYLNGVPDESGITYTLTGSASLVFSEKDHTVRIGVSKVVSDDSSPVTLDLGFSYTFRKKE
jgi:hypothetical protein